MSSSFKQVAFLWGSLGVSVEGLTATRLFRELRIKFDSISLLLCSYYRQKDILKRKVAIESSHVGTFTLFL